ncbi:PE family protein [Mycobacterium alsense]|uniref:PE family protein n=1 Tax=Mycobacterium alsense TaxID=324058 RepID=A0AA41XL01_9MYCO|nr:PE-PPE domain-containing protein [Mycobacterium alsense]MCV7378193.1 PE-PPE domain-containing protein [Mycobacterium alsense]OQZ93339.1 PE family protein [Mycobacterium alsense]
MTGLITVPETLAATAADVQGIGSAINTAGASAAGQTTGMVAAAQDEVSAAIADLFAAYGREYQAVLSQAEAFHAEFTRALTAAAGTYAQAEAANTALVSGVSNEITAPIRALLGQSPVTGGASTGGSSLISTVRLAAAGDPVVALIMGGTNNPEPDPIYVQNVVNAYIKNASAIQPLFTPEQFWPVTPGLGNLTFGQSVAQGVGLLDAKLNSLLAGMGNPNHAVVFGYSQSATIATNEINALMAAGSPHSDQLSFVLVGNPNNPVGGILSRFPGFYIPFLDVYFNGATPPNSPYPTSIYTAQYDGIADLPQYPLNLVSDLNAFMGYFFVHNTYPLMTATQVSSAVHLPTSPGYTGTNYYMFMTQNLPLLEPIRAIPYAGPPIADIFQPDLRVLVDLGYADYGPTGNYANIPTPAGLFSIPNPFTVIPYLALGAVQGPYGAAVEIGVEAGLVSPDLFPDTYPWVPSINPGLNISLGQSSVTLLSLLSGSAGSVLHLIPAPVFP